MMHITIFRAYGTVFLIFNNEDFTLKAPNPNFFIFLKCCAQSHTICFIFPVLKYAILCNSASVSYFPNKTVKKRVYLSDNTLCILKGYYTLKGLVLTRVLSRGWNGISKKYCATYSGWPVVELRFCPWLILFILFKYWTGWPHNFAITSGKGNKSFSQKKHVQTLNRTRSPRLET